MKPKKTLLIVEQAMSDLKMSGGNSDVIYLEGIFTEFKVRNRNGRIYEASDFIPKMNELLPKIEGHTLLGELDHPVNFDVSLKNASHVIEKLEYDEQNDRVIGKIRLLNTDAGKQAQALVRDGIPLHISSRAAGQINPQTGKVTLEKLFTYDLVADPGFENAELKRVNEAYGFGNMDNVYIYECDYVSDDDINNDNNKVKNMNTNESKTLNVEDFQKYTEYIAGVIENVKKSINELKNTISLNESKIQKIEMPNPKVVAENKQIGDYVNYLAEQLQKVSDHSDYLAEQLEKSNRHNDYLAEQIEKVGNHSDYLAEQIENGVNYSEYLAEKLDGNISHNDYLAEQMQKIADHSDYLAEQVQRTADHSDYLAEELQKTADHSDYLAEQLEKGIAYSEYVAEKVMTTAKYADYLAENLERGMNYSEYLGEQLQKTADHSDYLAEQLERNYAHNDYLAEKLNENYAHNDYLAEKLGENFDRTDRIVEGMQHNNMHNNVKVVNENKVAAINESSDTFAANKSVTESRKMAAQIRSGIKSNDDYKSAITEKLDALLNKHSEQVKPDNFLNFLSEGRKNEFNSLDNNTKAIITEAMNAAHVRNEEQANIVWKSVYESKKGLDLVENMPEIYRDRWNALSDKRKQEILNESKFYKINTTNEIEYFWSTRDLRDKTLVVERVDTDSARMWSEDKNKQDDHISSVLGRTKKGLLGY